MDILQSIIIAIVEGVTEFLPISSTGHMIITEKVLNVTETDFVKVFTVAIQLGAILAVVVLYWKKFVDFKQWQFYIKLAAAVVPALILGLLFSKRIDALLESSLTVAITMLAGGIILLFIDNLFKKPVIDQEEKISFPKAVIIGIWQCIAILAVPTMLAATGYKLYKYYKESGGFSTAEIQQLAIGNVVAFIVAMLAIKFFINFLKKHGFRVWGWYRIVVGIILLLLIYTGYIH